MEATAQAGRPPWGASPVRILEGQAGSQAAANAMRAYRAELGERLAGDPSLSHAEDAEVTPPNGDFCIVSEVATGETIGFGAVHVVEPGVVEIKRMWLRPDVRGRGLGKFLLKHLENRARALGGRRVILGVNAELVEACGLYRASGYEPVERFEDNPHITHFFGKQLVRDEPTRST